MNSRTTVLLLLVLAALGGAAWFLRPTGDVDPWAKQVTDMQDTQHPTLLATLGLNASRITRVSFASAGKPELTIARMGDAWQLAQPFQLALKPAQVDALLLLPLTETRVLGAEASLTDRAQGRVEITTADGRVVRLDLAQPQGAGVGSLRSGDKAWRVSTHLHDLLADLPPLASLVNPQLDLPPAGRLAKLTVTSGHSSLRVMRGKDGAQTGFTLDLPGAPRANAEAVALYCEELRKLRIVEIPQETASDAAFGFDKSPVTAVLEETGGGKTKLEVGGPTSPDLKRYFIRLTPPAGAPFVAAVETALVTALPQGADFFRDWRVSSMKAQDVRRLEIVRSCKPEVLADLSRDAQGNVVFTDSKTPFAVDAELGQAALAALANLKPTGAGPALRPLDPYLGLTLTDAFGRKEEFTLVDEGKTCALQRTGDAGSFTLPKAQVEVLLGGAEGLRDRALAGFGNDEITTLHLEQGACGLTHDFEKKDGKWTTSDGSSFEATAVEALERALKAPRAEVFLGAEICKKFESTLRLTAASSTKKLTLGTNDAGWGNFYGTDGKGHQLQFGKELRDLLASEFRPRQLLALAPAQIAWIEVQGTDTEAPVRISRQADGTYRTTGIGERTLTQASCAALFDTLGNLRSERPSPTRKGAFAMEGRGKILAVTVAETAGKNNSLTIFGTEAKFHDRTFVWDPASPQAKALKAILDQMNKPKQP